MSKEEFLKIQTCVLRVNIHCEGCRQKVKKILQKIDGVYTINIDSEQGKVTVSGDVDPSLLIKKLTKKGKHAELWGASNVNNNLQSQVNDQLKALQIEQAKCDNNKGQNQKGGNNQPKGGPQANQLPQLQQMKGFQDLKMPPPQFMKDLKMPLINREQNQKSVRFNLPEPEDEDLIDDDDDDDDNDDELDDDDLEDVPLNKLKPMTGNGQGGPQMPKMPMSNMMGGNGGADAKGGGDGGNIPVQMNFGSGGGGGENGGNKGNNGNNYGNYQNHGAGKGGQPEESRNGGGGIVGGGGGGQSMTSGAGSGGSSGGAANGNNFMANMAKNGGGMPNMMGMNPGGSMGLMSNLPVRPTGQISNPAAVQGLPTSAMNTSGGGRGAGYFQGAPLPEDLARNPYYQQQLAAMMMNQQQANGNERFQPMMYAPPPPAVNYMPPPYPPYQYPYAPQPRGVTEQYNMFSEENTSSCSVM